MNLWLFLALFSGGLRVKALFGMEYIETHTELNSA